MLVLAAVLSIATAGCGDPAGDFVNRCDHEEPNLYRLPPLPTGAAIAAEEHVPWAACGVHSSYRRLVTYDRGDAAALQVAILERLVADGFVVSHETAPLIVATSKKKRLGVSVIDGGEEARRWADVNRPATPEEMERVEEAKRTNNPALLPPGPPDHNWLSLNDELTRRLDELLAARTPVVALAIWIPHDT